MGLEVASFLNDLNTSNPVGTDAKSQGDDHLRLLKTVLKATFPGMTAGLLFDTTTLANTAQFLSTDAGATAGPIIDLYRNSASPATNDVLGEIDFNGKDDAGNKTKYSWIRGEAKVITNGSEDGRVVIGGLSNAVDKNWITFNEGGFTLLDADADAVDTIAGGADANQLTIQGGNTAVNGGGMLLLYGNTHATNAGDVVIADNGTFKYSYDRSDAQHEFYIQTTFTGGTTFFQQNSTTTPGNGNNTVGAAISTVGALAANTSSSHSLGKTGDGSILLFGSAGTIQGSVSISGATVSYNAFMGSHWAEIVGEVPLPWSIMETVDEPSKFAERDNLRLPKAQVCEDYKSEKVYGVYSNEMNDEPGKHIIAGLGAGFVRIEAGFTVRIGDLIMNGINGCGVPQQDSIFGPHTVAKVTATYHVCDYDDGSFVVPATLHCG